MIDPKLKRIRKLAKKTSNHIDSFLPSFGEYILKLHKKPWWKFWISEDEWWENKSENVKKIKRYVEELI